MNGSDTDVTARALAAVEASRARADKAVPTGYVYGEPGEIKAVYPRSRATSRQLGDALNRVLVADVTLLATIAAAAVRLVARATAVDGRPWWGIGVGLSAGCFGCGAATRPYARDEWAAIVHADDCAAMQLDAAIRAAGEAGLG